jgi:hypothetical protein
LFIGSGFGFPGSVESCQLPVEENTDYGSNCYNPTEDRYFSQGRVDNRLENICGNQQFETKKQVVSELVTESFALTAGVSVFQPAGFATNESTQRQDHAPENDSSSAATDYECGTAKSQAYCFIHVASV